MEMINYYPVSKKNDCTKFKSLSNTAFCFPLRETFMSALESCVDTLAIYQHTLMDLDNFSTTIPPTECSDRSKRLMSENLNRCETLNKLERDSAHVRQLLEDAKNEMREDGTVNALIKVIDGSERKELEERNTLLNYIEIKKTVETLKKKLNDEIIIDELEIEALRATLSGLREEKETLKLETGLETRYTSSWEKAQLEQCSLRCNITLERLSISLQNCSIRKKNEDRIAREIEAFLKQNISFNNRSSSHWQDRYNREMQIYAEKNRKLRDDILTQWNTLKQLEDEFSKRQRFIDGYLAEKEAAKSSREFDEYKRSCAIRIQAWWRGTMVRRKLGPYRPDDKKKKRPPKAKK